MVSHAVCDRTSLRIIAVLPSCSHGLSYSTADLLGFRKGAAQRLLSGLWGGAVSTCGTFYITVRLGNNAIRSVAIR